MNICINLVCYTNWEVQLHFQWIELHLRVGKLNTLTVTHHIVQLKSCLNQFFIPSDVFLSSKGLQIYSQIFTNLFTNSQIKIFKLLKLFGLSTGFEIHEIALI